MRGAGGWLVVVGLGGYASGPAMMAAILLRVPTVAFEPNAVPGLANRVVERWVSAAAVNFARVGSQKLWAGTVIIQPNAKTGAHHHGALESVIYVVRGAARMRWGERLEFTAKAEAGDFIFVPPYVPHQEINALSDAPLECVLVRSDNESVVVNLNIDAAERFEEVYWIDPIHPAPR